MSKSVLICMNAFKGTLTNAEACAAVSEALGQNVSATILPLGDGGRGTFESISGETIRVPATDPMGREVTAKAILLPDSVLIESSETCGYHLLNENQRDPMRASSHGLGTQIRAVLEQYPKIQQVFVGLGDSATSDAGMGMLQSLGFRFEGIAGNELWGNADTLRQIKKIIPPRENFRRVQFTVLCDVLNPLCGPTGAAQTYSPQKGAKAGQVKLIEEGMENFAAHVLNMTGRKIKSEPMTGAAGGISAAFLAFFQARLVHGANYLLDWVNFDGLLSKHDLLITGEGRTDSQTASGKAPYECIRRANQLKKKVVLVSGSLDRNIAFITDQPSVIGCFESGEQPNPKEALVAKVREIFAGDLNKLVS